jgi:selenocysteine lyase/cysteine desulfurase
MLDCQRAQFSLDDGVHYLNCAYLAPLARVVETAALGALGRLRDPWTVGPDAFFGEVDRLRALFAKLVNAPSGDSVAVVPSASYGVATVTANLGLRRGQTVVVVGNEFPGGILPWHRAAKAAGARVVTVLEPEASLAAASRGRGEDRGARWSDALCEAITSDTAAVMIPTVHWYDGITFDAGRIAKAARTVGAAVIVDGTQSVGAFPFDCAAVQPDALVCSGYKWLLGPYGLSVAYIGPRFVNGLPLEDTWTGQVGSEDMAALAGYRFEYRSGASRFDSGQRASFVLVPMLTAALTQLLAWGPDRIQQYSAHLAAPLFESADKLRLVVDHSPGRAKHLVGVRFADGRDVGEVARRLAAGRVFASVRGDAIRVAFQVFNNQADVEALLAAFATGDS